MCFVLECTLQLWTIDSCAYVWQQILVHSVWLESVCSDTLISQLPPSECKHASSLSGRQQRATNQVCKWMLYIIILFIWSGGRLKQQNGRCVKPAPGHQLGLAGRDVAMWLMPRAFFGPRRVAARCGCKWTAVTRLHGCLSCCHDTLAVVLSTFLHSEKSCRVELGFKSRLLMSVPSGSPAWSAGALEL